MSVTRKGYLHLAMQSLRVSRARSFMTMLGIIIGIMAVILIVGISEGVKKQIGSQTDRYGKNVLTIRPMQSGSVANSALPSGASTLLTSADMEVIRKTHGVQNVVPLSFVQGAVKGEKTIDNPLVIATTPDFADLIRQKVEFGGFFTAADGDRAVVLGDELAAELFSDNAPLGREVQFRGQTFMVAGVFKQFLAAPLSLEANFNHAMFMPYSAAQTMLGAAPQAQEVFAKVAPTAVAKDVALEVEKKLQAAHGDTHDMVALTADSKAVRSTPVLSLLTRLTVGTALVALLVGGVGIMNMMLLIVTERIHEIGLRKAVGATNSQILRQFVAEAVALCAIGAVLGCVFSLAAIGILRAFSSLQPVVVWPVVVLVPLVAFATGVLFGTIPAVKAARMDPIEALRHE